MKKSMLVIIAVMISACGNIGRSPTPTLTPEGDLPPAVSPSLPDLTRLQVVGNRIVNEDGQIVVLRGLGVAEMVYLATATNDIPWNEDLFRTVHDWGATVIRVPIAPVWFFQDEERSFELLDQAIHWAREYGMYVIINFQGFGFPPTGFLMDSDSVENASNVDTIRFWQAVSSRYAENNTVAFYEIFNEAASHPWDGITYAEDWDLWKDFSELVIDFIRENDPETIVIVGGLRWSADLSYAQDAPIQRSNVAYALHLYPNTSDDWDATFGNLAEKHSVILSDTSFGIDILGEQSWLNESNYNGAQPYREAFIEYTENRELSWVATVFSSQWVPQLVMNRQFEPTEVGRFFRDQLSGYNRTTTTGELIHTNPNIFNDAVGRWESIDPDDGSQRTLVISSIGNHGYDVRYIDESVPLCNGNRPGNTFSGAEATGSGEAFYQKLDLGPLFLDCSNGWVGGLLFESLVYDPEMDTLSDIQGTIWSRSNADEANSVEVGFAGAIGEWTCTDVSDGSIQTLSINHQSPNLFTIDYIDEGASFCGQDTNGLSLFSAEGSGQGEPFGRALSLNLDFVCIGDPDGTTATFSIELLYDPLTDVITDSFANQWVRSD